MTIFMILGILTTIISTSFWIFITTIIVKKVKYANGTSKNYKRAFERQIERNLMNEKRDNIYSGGHNHAYEHKVQPIVEATVHERFEDRKEAYIERKQQMKADLPKTSYSRMEQMSNSSWNSSYSQSGYNNYGQNGDTLSVGNLYEENIKCKYCGANNIVPKSRNKAYNCYFCREMI